MRLRADVHTREGIVYSFFLIRVYVSLRLDVSNGGLPTSSVYLPTNQTTIVHTIKLFNQSRNYIQYTYELQNLRLVEFEVNDFNK